MEKKSLKFRTKAPFGIQTVRFHEVGFHPGLDPTGVITPKSYNLGPGEYDITPHECSYKNYLVSGSCWKRKVEMEEYSNTLGFRNTALLEERKYRESLAGPGTYNVPEDKPHRSSCLDNVGFGTEKRFPVNTKCNYPPPGTYAKGIKKLMDKYRFEQNTPVPTFEWDGFLDRFRSTEPPWAKPPNWYSPVDTKSIAATLRKLVSKRGPYDLFTGPREDTNIKNHFGKSNFAGPLNFFNVWPNEFELLLSHPRNKNKGKFFRVVRFGIATQRHMIDDPTQSKRDPDGPGPVSYDLCKKRDVKESKHPFGTSLIHARPPTNWEIRPGVGRYNLRTPACSNILRESWVFKTKIGRPVNTGPRYSDF